MRVHNTPAQAPNNTHLSCTTLEDASAMFCFVKGLPQTMRKRAPTKKLQISASASTVSSSNQDSRFCTSRFSYLSTQICKNHFKQRLAILNPNDRGCICHVLLCPNSYRQSPLRRAVPFLPRDGLQTRHKGLFFDSAKGHQPRNGASGLLRVDQQVK